MNKISLQPKYEAHHTFSKYYFQMLIPKIAEPLNLLCMTLYFEVMHNWP